MLKELVYPEEGVFEPPPGVEYDSHYNRVPKPYWEVSEHEYIHFATCYSYRFREYRQARMPDVFPFSPTNMRKYPERCTGTPKETMMPLMAMWIEWYHDRGYAIVHPWGWHCANEADLEKDPLLKIGDVVYEERFRYFRIGCKHEHKTSTRHSMHVYSYMCDDCGFYSGEIDSSG